MSRRLPAINQALSYLEMSFITNSEADGSFQTFFNAPTECDLLIFSMLFLTEEVNMLDVAIHH